MTFFQKVYSMIQTVPRGKVTTYGQIALLLERPRLARQVGWALHQLDSNNIEKVPWYRVVNREGRISTKCLSHSAMVQAESLKNEGIAVEYKHGNYWIDLDRFMWKP